MKILTEQKKPHSARIPLLAALLALGLNGCQPGSSPEAVKKTVIQNTGSDTMVNLATSWAEEYAKAVPSVSVEVSGGGSGQGIAALINGSCDLANCSRRFEEKEVAELKAKTGKDPKEFTVGFDALSIFVHKNNPLNEISLEQLAEIYRDDGKITQWSSLGVTIPGARGDEIIRVSRQNNSGTYQYFKEAVLGKNHEFKLGSLDMNGSKDVVELISKTPNAIGYSGMGYATPEVKVLRVSRKKGEPAVSPSIATTLDKTYPISRPLFMYTDGEPSAPVRNYIDWVMSDAGQRILEHTGYVPLPKK
jgi:phosphate transport system substrate-binding protein